MNLINKKVTYNDGQKGEIIDQNGNICSIKVDGEVKKCDIIVPVENGILTIDDPIAQKEVIDLINEKNQKDAEYNRKVEEANKAYEERAKQANEQSNPQTRNGKPKKNLNNNKKSGSIRPAINQRRNNGKSAIFQVCQNDNYQVESTNGYIWAPTHDDETDPASHAEMDHVKAGDIIFHHFNNTIWAISVAKKDKEIKERIGVPGQQLGRFVELAYHFLDHPVDTSCFMKEKAEFGSHKYGPFDVNGKNKQGVYLTELSDALAKIFIDAAINANPSDTDLLDFKAKI